MWFIWAILSALLFGLSGFYMKYGQAKKGSVAYLLLGLYLSGTLGFLLLALVNKLFTFHWGILLAGIIVGLGSTLGNVLFMKALECGPASLTSPLANANIVLVVIMSIIVYGETLSMLEIFAIILLIVSVSLLPIDPQESLSITNRAWYLFVGVSVILFFFRNGGLKITEELAYHNTVVLFYAYLLGIFWSVGQVYVEQKQQNAPDKRAIRTGLYSGLVAGVFSFGGMQLYSYALADGPASIVSPIFSLNSLVVAILSIVIFKERLSRFQQMALLGTFLGIVLLRI